MYTLGLDDTDIALGLWHSSGLNSGNEENFFSKLTVSSTLSIPSSTFFLKKLRFPDVEPGVSGTSQSSLSSPTIVSVMVWEFSLSTCDGFETGTAEKKTHLSIQMSTKIISTEVLQKQNDMLEKKVSIFCIKDSYAPWDCLLCKGALPNWAGVGARTNAWFSASASVLFVSVAGGLGSAPILGSCWFREYWKAWENKLKIKAFYVLYSDEY